MNDNDTVPSTKVLLFHELIKLFPEGYKIAFPDRECGFVISNNCPNQQLNDIENFVKKVYKNATVPMSDKLYPYELFNVVDLSIPLDKELSNSIVDFVLENTKS